jgi:hypothetical protein
MYTELRQQHPRLSLQHRWLTAQDGDRVTSMKCRSGGDSSGVRQKAKVVHPPAPRAEPAEAEPANPQERSTDEAQHQA